MGINEQLAQSAVQEMKQLWGGNLPTWEDYKIAYKNGRVRANKTVAAEAIHMKGIPKAYLIIVECHDIVDGFSCHDIVDTHAFNVTCN
jgi:hypothetical protein